MITKPESLQFAEWMDHFFGYCYGSGEAPIIEALQKWFNCLHGGSHDYKAAEKELGPTVEWLLVNVLCRADVMAYGSSPRYGWLTLKGQRLAAYMQSHSVEDLAMATQVPDHSNLCSPLYCYCDHGDGTKPCANNSFWVE